MHPRKGQTLAQGPSKCVVKTELHFGSRSQGYPAAKIESGCRGLVVAPG